MLITMAVAISHIGTKPCNMGANPPVWHLLKQIALAVMLLPPFLVRHVEQRFIKKGVTQDTDLGTNSW